MKNMLSLALLCSLLVATAWPQENNYPVALQSLIQAERDFAKYCVEHNVRDSFIKFFADDGINFLPHPTNTKEAFGKRPPVIGKPPLTLNWAPVYGDVAASGELGYSTGPTLTTDNTPQQRPASHGLFFSVWKKQANGDWRVIVDLGVPLETAFAPLDKPYQRAPQWQAKVPAGENGETSLRSLLKAESDFFTLAKEGKGWQKYLHEAARLYRRNRVIRNAKDWLREADGALSGETIKAEVARSGELGYSYGKYELSGNEKGYYTRIWKRDAQGLWRIVFDVTSPLPPEQKKSGE